MKKIVSYKRLERKKKKKYPNRVNYKNMQFYNSILY